MIRFPMVPVPLILSNRKIWFLSQKEKNRMSVTNNRAGRPKGFENKIKKELREILTNFAESKMLKISSLYNELPPREKARFIHEILPYWLPKYNSTDYQDSKSSQENTQSEFFARINDHIHEATLRMDERDKE